MIVFDGFDAAGKVGVIKKVTETLDPRSFVVNPIGPPSALEQGKHYLYRFWTKLPCPGMIVIFDRSWSTYLTGKQLTPGCVLTARDHSVMILGQSQGMCFFYEATSPYGPPQVRAVPCTVLSQKYSRQYCPNGNSIAWQILQND